jgi:hypothetical protein
MLPAVCGMTGTLLEFCRYIGRVLWAERISSKKPLKHKLALYVPRGAKKTA